MLWLIDLLVKWSYGKSLWHLKILPLPKWFWEGYWDVWISTDALEDWVEVTTCQDARFVVAFSLRGLYLGYCTLHICDLYTTNFDREQSKFRVRGPYGLEGPGRWGSTQFTLCRHQYHDYNRLCQHICTCKPISLEKQSPGDFSTGWCRWIFSTGWCYWYSWSDNCSHPTCGRQQSSAEIFSDTFFKLFAFFQHCRHRQLFLIIFYLTEYRFTIENSGRWDNGWRKKWPLARPPLW